MRVVNNDQTFIVGWKYENPNLERMLENNGISKEQAKDMKGPEICKALGIRNLPLPTVTKCIVKREYEVLNETIVRKFPKDAYDKDKARKYSLGKALRSVFPGLENKQIRTEFWKAYFDRRKTAIEAAADRLLEGDIV